MKLEKSKKITEPMREKRGAKLKAERTYESEKREKEGDGKVVKSKMKMLRAKGELRG